MQVNIVAVVSLIFAMTIATNEVDAATSDRFRYQTAPKDCQGALPAFAGTLRARPLGLGNEGDATAFVTCGFVGDGNYHNETTNHLAVRVGNNGPNEVTITCTLVDGFGGSVYSAVYLPKSVTVDVGVDEIIFWNAGEAGPGTDLETVQMSCSLPPGAIIYHTFSFGSEEIGS